MKKNIIPERRFVTVLFADIKGFTSLSESLDPEDVESIINDIFSAFRVIIEDHDGYLDKFIGDAVMAVFGAPKSHSDDPRRAILSAIRMQKILKEFNEEHGLSLGLRIGINTGEVLWSSIAGEKPTVMGDVVNVAQRLESISEPGKIFVSNKTKELADNFFDFETRGEITVKGRKEPVKVYEVIREKSEKKMLDSAMASPLLERDTELAKLEELYRNMIDNGNVKVAMVVGEAGIGKTRLSLEFLKKVKSEEKGVNSIFVRGDPLRQGSYQIISQIISEIVGRNEVKEIRTEIERIFRSNEELSEVEAKTFTRLVLSMIYPSVEHKGGINTIKERNTAIFTFLLSVFNRGDRPFIIVIDDFHYVDEDSFSILSQIKDNITRSRVIFIFNSRKEFPNLSFDKIIKLKPLSKGATYSLIRSIFNLKDEKISKEFVDLVIEKTGGNPYYVEELIKYIKTKTLYEKNPVRVKEDAFHIPETLISILTERIDAMTEELKEVVKIASCIGKMFWRGVLEIVIGKEIESFLFYLEREGIIARESKSIIENDTEYVFVHELLRDAAYSLLTKKERIKLHNTIGGILELYDNNATLLYNAANHFVYAQNIEKANKLFEKAGDLSKKQANFRFALKCYEGVKKDFPELLLKKAEVLEILSEYDKAITLIERALQILKKDEDNDLYSLLLIRLSSIKEKQGDFNATLEILRSLEGGSPILRAEILGRIAWAHFRLSNYEEAIETAKSAFIIINRLNQSNPEVIVRKGLILNVLANLYTKRGEFDKAYKFFDEAISIYRLLDDKDRLSKILINVSTYLIYKGEHEGALSLLNEALEYVTQTANRGLLPAIYNNIGLVYMNSGEIEMAIANFNNALKISRNIGNKYTEMNVLINISRAYSSMELYREAEKSLNLSLNLAKRVGDRSTESIALANLAFVYYVIGELDMAEQRAREAFFVFEELKNTHSLLDLFPTYMDILLIKGEVRKTLLEIEKYKDIIKSLQVEDKIFHRILLRKSVSYYIMKDREKCVSTLKSLNPKLLNAEEVAILLVLKSLIGISILEEEFLFFLKMNQEPFTSIYNFLKGTLDKSSLLRTLERHPRFKFLSIVLQS